MEEGKVTWQLVLFQNCILWWLLVSEKYRGPLCLPGPWGQWHVGSNTMNSLKSQRLCWGTGSTPRVFQTLVWPLMLAETELLELEEVGSRSCMGSQHHLVTGDSGFCPVFNSDGLPGCLVIAQAISRSKSLMLRSLWQGVRPMKHFFLNVSQLQAVGGRQR